MDRCVLRLERTGKPNGNLWKPAREALVASWRFMDLVPKTLQKSCSFSISVDEKEIQLYKYLFWHILLYSWKISFQKQGRVESWVH